MTTRDVPNEVAQALKAGNACASLRALCVTYTEDQLHRASDVISPIHYAYHNVIAEALRKLRHEQLSDRLDALQKPHPVVQWTLYVAWLALVIAILTLIVCLGAWLYPRSSADANSFPFSPQTVATSPFAPVVLPSLESTQSLVVPAIPLPAKELPQSNATPSVPAEPKSSKPSL